MEEFWQEFLTQTNRSPATTYMDCFHFELSEKLADELLGLVLSGQKCATSSSRLAYEAEGTRLPEAGDLSIVTDFAGTPHCVIETTAVTVLPYEEVTYALAKREGEDENLASWREGHERFFRSEGKLLGYQFTPEMLVVFEDFHVVYQK